MLVSHHRPTASAPRGGISKDFNRPFKHQKIPLPFPKYNQPRPPPRFQYSKAIQPNNQLLAMASLIAAGVIVYKGGQYVIEGFKNELNNIHEGQAGRLEKGIAGHVNPNMGQAFGSRSRKVLAALRHKQDQKFAASFTKQKIDLK